MLIEEIVDTEIEEAKMAWARRGNKVVRKFRCTSGPRKGRIVANPSQCFKAPDVKKRMTLRRTKSKMGKRLVRKAGRTKRLNPVSRRVQRLNK